MRRTRASLAVLVLTSSVYAARGYAQSTAAFEVVSVKPSTAQNDQTASFVQPGARYTASNMTLRMLVKTAYGVHDDQVVGGPPWIESDRFDIAAKAEGNPSISAWADRLVIDRTGLMSKFDWDLQWTMEPLTPDATRPPGLSLFTAVREQLGLRLESQRGVADVLVVERVERPLPD